MIKKTYNLTIFDDGAKGTESGAGAQAGATPGAAAGTAGAQAGAGAGAAPPSYSFEQAEEIANRRAEHASRTALASYFRQQGLTEDQITEAIGEYKRQQAEKTPNIEAITKERDDALAEVAKMKNIATLSKYNIPDKYTDYVLFSVDKLLASDSKLTFEKAVESFIKDNPEYSVRTGYRVKTSPDAGSTAGGKTNDRDILNASFRSIVNNRR